MTAHTGPWNLRGLITGVTIATAAYLGLSLWAGWKDVALAFVQIGVGGTLLALSMSLVNYGLRFLRWQSYLKGAPGTPPWQASLRIYLAGFALTMTPGKAGEALRAILLARHGVPYSRTFTALISERLADLAVIALFSALGLSLYEQARVPVLTGAALIALFVLGVSNRRLMLRLHERLAEQTGKWRSLFAHAVKVMLDVRANLHPRSLLPAILIGIVAWGAEGLAFHWILGWMSFDVTLTFALFVYALSMLAGALSMLPGGIGGAEAVMVSLLVHHGIALPSAIAATVFIRLATLWFAILIGLLALARSDTGREATP